MQRADRSYEGSYDLYDYRETYSYIAFKRYLAAKTLLKGYAAFKIKNFGNILGESFREPHGKLEIKRFFQSRTTLGLAVRFGAKFYYDDAASNVWGTLNLPSTSQSSARLSQFSTRLNFSQGISNRVGARGWVDYSVNLGDYPSFIDQRTWGENQEYFYVIFDNPLLDRYARDGLNLFGALKVLGPHQTWLEGGASFGDHDYGALMFPSDDVDYTTLDEGQKRLDKTKDYYFSLTRILPGTLGKPKLALSGGWLERESSVERYTYSGAYYSSSMTWRW
ncbi:MAG: hypothetical protein KOO60_00130 [Gemmatimonadales bacterium]|nr:hypothetical protein [Gemmatimonadales bacterium]